MNLLTIKQFSEIYPAFTEGCLRALIFNAAINGFDKVIKRISPTGRRGRVFIDVDAFFMWISEQNKNIA